MLEAEKKPSFFNYVGSEEALHIVEEDSTSVITINRRKCNLFSHILLGNCLIEHNRACKKRGNLKVRGR